MTSTVTDDERSRRPTREDVGQEPEASSNAKPAVELPTYTKPLARYASVRCAEQVVGEMSDQEKKDEAFLEAVAKCDLDAVKAALLKRQEINIAKEDGTTAVHLAAQHKDTAILDLLLNNRPNVMFADKRGNLAITKAIHAGSIKAFEALVASKLVDLTYVNPQSGNSLLHEVTWICLLYTSPSPRDS